MAAQKTLNAHFLGTLSGHSDRRDGVTLSARITNGPKTVVDRPVNILLSEDDLTWALAFLADVDPRFGDVPHVHETIVSSLVKRSLYRRPGSGAGHEPTSFAKVIFAAAKRLEYEYGVVPEDEDNNDD